MTNTFTERKIQPYRYDHVGSFLRPERLKQAREDHRKDLISDAELRKIEDEEIIKLIQKEEEAGLKDVSDGEFRRSWWHYDFMWGLGGLEKFYPEHGQSFAATETRAESVRISGELNGKNHPFIQDFQFVRDHVSKGIEPKQTIPAPAQLLQELLREYNIDNTRKYFKTDEELIDGIAKAYGETLADFYQSGAKVVQFDDCTWGRLVSINPDKLPEDEREEALTDKEYKKKIYLEVNNKAIAAAPEGLVINTHICRGNYKSTWFGSGGYESVADALLAKENVGAYFLEFDSERAGGFEPLKQVSGDKLVVLGLITSKTGELEDRGSIIKRIEEASQYLDLDRLCLSTQCGFSSVEEGNAITEDQQWAKIQLVKSIAEEVWGPNL